MIVRKFMRLLLVPGMAVPLVLVACSGDDSDPPMAPDTMGRTTNELPPDAGLSIEDIDGEQIKAAAGQPYNGSERSELSFDGSSFEIGIGSEKTIMVPMAEATRDQETLMAGATKLTRYHITKDLKTGQIDDGTLQAVVLTGSEPANSSGEDDNGETPQNHLAFGVWIVKDKGEDEMHSVGAFGAHGFDRTSVEEALPNNGQDDVSAKFSGRSVGVATTDDSNIAFDAMVSLTAKWLANSPRYLLEGNVQKFKFDGDGFEIGQIKLKNAQIKNGIARGDTRLVSDGTVNPTAVRGNWQAGFASANSIVGSYGISVGKTHLIGSFGAYKDPTDTDDMP